MRVLLLPVVMLSTISYQLTGWMPLAIPGFVALVLYLLSEWPRLGNIPRTVLVAAVFVLCIFFLRMPAPQQALLEGFGRAAWFATFLAALSYLREAAETSPLVRQCGRVIINQPPTKRYATLSAGSLMIGVLLNMAVLNLLGVMARRANSLVLAGGDSEVRAARTRRMSTAITRGFSTSPLGSPLTMTMAVILSVFPALQWWRFWPLGLGATVLLMLLGIFLDRRDAPRHLVGRIPALTAGPESGHPVLRFLLLVGAVFIAAVLVEQWLQVTLALAILLVAPVAALIWLTMQFRRFGPGRGFLFSLTRLRRRAPAQFSGLRAETAVLCAGALMGTLVAAMLPVHAFADAMAHVGLHGLPVALLVLVLMTALPQLGLNPILVATILLASMAQPAVFGISAELLALSIASGWALAVSCSPVATTVLISSQLIGVSPQTLGWRWNGVYVAVGVLVCALWLSLANYFFL
ncbi:hypothetical protein K8B33_00450 [Alcanivorax sp. JB21]|uniref:hypothetical protein n=1 Tax=Alcanivorax limicola TaxID=2874102 RepID=UPI001CBE9F12|nr:hypothetical protein [Alcanivorax limicola]MBZ2187554.1 hypothetical protein [Alcanivorax limicola]